MDNKEAKLILQVLKDSLDDLSIYSAENGDIFNQEIAEIEEHIQEMKEKII